jgi:hypothetical protein
MRETFKCAMDINFKGLIGQSVVVYLDDVIVYSKKDQDHPQHLKQIFKRCRKYGISLNPKKSIFLFQKGNYLGMSSQNMGFLWILKEQNPSCRFLFPITRSPCNLSLER